MSRCPSQYLDSDVDCSILTQSGPSLQIRLEAAVSLPRDTTCKPGEEMTLTCGIQADTKQVYLAHKILTCGLLHPFNDTA